MRCTGECDGSPASTAVLRGDDAFFGRVFVSRVEVDFDSAPRYLALHLVRAIIAFRSTRLWWHSAWMGEIVHATLLPASDRHESCALPGRLRMHDTVLPALGVWRALARQLATAAAYTPLLARLGSGIPHQPDPTNRSNPCTAAQHGPSDLTPPSPPSASPTLQAGGKKFEVGEAGRRCGGKGPMDCASFDSDRLLPKSAFEDTRVGRRIRFFNLRGTWGGEQGALVQLLPIYVAYRTPPQA